MQAGVEPLRGVRRNALGGEHIGKFVTEGGGVFFAGEIAALPAPIGPGAGQAIENLAGIGLGTVVFFLGQSLQRIRVRDRPPEEGGDVVLLDALHLGRNAGLAEILLGENVGRDLAELSRNVDIG
ncbi:hypothetical protein D9M72_447760 [compost metagenome]